MFEDKNGMTVLESDFLRQMPFLLKELVYEIKRLNDTQEAILKEIINKK